MSGQAKRQGPSFWTMKKKEIVMPKFSAGILVYKFNANGEILVLLVHPGGPLWKNKDIGAWSIPKGEYVNGEEPLAAAKREFCEETGSELPDGDYLSLEPVKMKSGKIISAWAVNTAFDVNTFRSNEFEMEWPPRSGTKKRFPEVDKIAWFTLGVAKTKINVSQQSFIEQLGKILKANL
jgi:predicted NUDIX family NTP pyrophosphohydrolase